MDEIHTRIIKTPVLIDLYENISLAENSRGVWKIKKLDLTSDSLEITYEKAHFNDQFLEYKDVEGVFQQNKDLAWENRNSLKSPQSIMNLFLLLKELWENNIFLGKNISDPRNYIISSERLYFLGPNQVPASKSLEDEIEFLMQFTYTAFGVRLFDMKSVENAEMAVNYVIEDLAS